MLNEIHDLPLANRLVDDEIRNWLDTHLGLLAAQTSDDSPERKIVDQARHLHLDNYWYVLTPKILDALRRADLLAVTDREGLRGSGGCSGSPRGHVDDDRAGLVAAASLSVAAKIRARAAHLRAGGE
jgi:hypothetical protein